MLKDPIDLLQERLNDIDSIDCRDKDFIEYKNKYKWTIDFLVKYGLYEHKKGRKRKLTTYDIKFIQDYCNIGQIDYYANMFGVHKSTIQSVLTDKKKYLLSKVKKHLEKIEND